uniref:Uncharacterized protein n=1 Tax=Graphocephala atropunctata TaxID=36148 RepID=A0A1B6M2J8_9HEMI
METIVYSYLKYRGTNEAVQAREIQATYGEPLSFNDASLLSQQHRKDNIYILSKFVKILTPVKYSTTSKVLKLLFKEIRANDDNLSNVKPTRFRVVVLNQCAQSVEKAISEKMIRPGDIVTFHQPTILVLSTIQTLGNKLTSADNGLCIEINGVGNQLVNVWQPYSNSFIDSVRCKYSYRHLAIYDMDHTGSTYHAVSNLLHLAKSRGCVMTLREIADDRSPRKKVALVFLKETLSSPINLALTGEVRMSFEEIILEETSQTILTSIFPQFTAIFSGDLAKELQKAVTDGHVALGDMVALCHPTFKEVTTAPIRIEFPTDGEKLVILKCHPSDLLLGSKVAGFDLNLHQPRESSCTFSDTSKIKSLLNVGNFQILLFRDVIDKVSVLECISNEMAKFGKVETLENMYQKHKFGKKKESGVILACFLKTVLPIQNQGKPNRTLLFLKEICPDHTWGRYFKSLLHDNLAKDVHEAVQNKSIVRGDIISFVSPIIHHNPKFTSRDFIIEEPYILEIGAQRDKGRVIACHLSSNDGSSLDEPEQLRNCRQRNEAVTKRTFKRPADKDKKNTISSELKKEKSNTQVGSQSQEHLVHSQMKSLLKIKPTEEMNDLVNCRTSQGSQNNKHSDSHQSKPLESTACRHENSKRKIANMDIKSGHGNCSSIAKNSNTTMQLESKDIQRNNREESLPTKVIGPALRETENYCVIPVCVTKPCLKNSLDLISGYCYQGCHKMHVYSTIKWDIIQDPLCPMCSLKLKLVLCFELGALKFVRHVKLLFVGVEAEKLLNVGCEEFLISAEARDSAIKLLENITSTEYKKPYTIRLSDVTYWEFS